MEFILSVIFELFLELGIQVIFESIARFIRLLFRPFGIDLKRLPSLATIGGYLLTGAVFGWVSLMAFPGSPPDTAWLKWLHLLLIPPGVGGLFVMFGHWLEKRGKRVTGFERFGCGTAFAFGFALVRFIWGR